MKAAASLALLSTCIIASPAAAACRIDTFVEISLVGYTLTSNATVTVTEYFPQFGGCDALDSGSHIMTSSSYDIVASRNYVRPAFGEWEWRSQNLVSSGDPGVCYRGSIDAQAGSLSQGATTAAYCLPETGGNEDPTPIDTSQYCPLILDLNGDGIHTSGLNEPVYFWTLDGRKVRSGWTNPATEEAFLWIDVDRDYGVREEELFGSRMLSTSGTRHRNGFQALAAYDRVDHGGNGDGFITHEDRIWGRLRLWVDRNHDGAAQPTETSPVAAHGIVSLGLARTHDHSPDAWWNSVMLVGSYTRRMPGGGLQQLAMVDIGFMYLP